MNAAKSPQWEEAKKELLDLAEMKNISIDEVLKKAKVSSLEQLSLERLKGAHAYLAQL